MTKSIGIDELVYAAEGPRKKVPTYQFRRRTFKEHEKPPGQHVRNDESNSSGK